MRVTIPDIKKKKAENKKITMLTSYDAPFTKIIDKCGIDVILVGDSLGMVVQGNENTLSVTLDEMIYHTKIVVNNCKNSLVIADMPFLTYQISIEDAIKNCGEVIKKTNAQGVKIEGGAEYKETIKALVKASIPVMGHIGLLPQSVNKIGSFKVQGKSDKEREYLINSAIELEEAGAFAIVLEAIPYDLAQEITKSISIPTIGIGAGPYTDGQVLVIYDLLGMDSSFNPKFLKKYVNLELIISDALSRYKHDVENSLFPDLEHSFKSHQKPEKTEIY